MGSHDMSMDLIQAEMELKHQQQLGTLYSDRADVLRQLIYRFAGLVKGADPNRVEFTIGTTVLRHREEWMGKNAKFLAQQSTIKDMEAKHNDAIRERLRQLRKRITQ